MRYTIVLLFALAAISLTASVESVRYSEKYHSVISGSQPVTDEVALNMYEEFVALYKGADAVSNNVDKYPTFFSNLMTINKHNQDETKTWKMGINEYSDLTEQEFFDHFNLHPNESQNCSATASPRNVYESQIPIEHDWRNISMPHGIKVVTPVKNQGKCGSCWAFSTVAAMESHYTLASTKYAILSEQQLVDCAQDYGNNGCSGGLPSYAFNYIRDNGITFESRYPYRANDGQCQYFSKSILTTGSFNITAYDEVQLAEELYSQGPVSVAFQVIGDFRHYESGVYTTNDCKNGPMDVNHAVLAVGYGVENGLDHLIIKNSWGADWGNQGFFKIQRGVNMCGIAVCNSYPQRVTDIWSSPAETLLTSA